MVESSGPITRSRARSSQHSPNAASSVSNGVSDVDENKYAKEVPVKLGYKQWMVAAIFLTGVCSLVRYLDLSFPDVIPKERTDTFSEERAREWLKELTKHGSRVSGSYNTEVMARRQILDSLADVKRIAEGNGANKVEYQEQRPSGCFDLSFLSSFTLCYREVLNIVVRFGPKSRSPTSESVLVSCHFDSVSEGAGATDDGVSCAIMMDILRVLAHSKEEIANDLIFLFNGAEENFLQAAHGFITTHPWRHTIRAFINLEGAGAGGREILFQAGPGNAWLVKSYIDSAPYPHCSVMAQEVFETGIIPSDTDFRIYRDYGRVPGLDIAYARNGYVYHTEFDQEYLIEQGAIQRAGENVMATLLNLLSSPYLAHPGDYHEGRWVFLDVVGLFNIFYPLNWGVVLNYLIVAAVIGKIAFQLGKASEGVSYGKESRYSVLDFVFAVWIHLGTSAAIVMVMVGLSLVVNALGLGMVWYARHFNLIPLYVAPGILAGFYLHTTFRNKFFAKRDPFVMEQVFFDAMLAIVGSLLFVMTWTGFASAFLALMHTAFPLFRDLSRRCLAALTRTNDRNPWVLLTCHLLGVLPVSFIASYALVICIEFFVPMMGRMGQNNPEVAISALCALGAVSCVLHFGSWIYASRKIDYLLKCGMWFEFLSVFLLLTTQLGHPYVYSVDSPRLRRVHSQHVVRKLYNEDGSVGLSQSGLFMATMDYRGVEDLPVHSFLQGSTKVNCSNAPDAYCSMPYYVPVYSMFPADAMIWLAATGAPEIPIPIQLELVSERNVVNGMVEQSFSLKGPDHMTLFITPVNGWHLQSWSFTNGGIHRNTKTYFVYLAYAQQSGPWEFTLTFKHDTPTEANLARKKMVLGVGSHFLHGEHMKSPQIKQIENLIRERRETPEAAIGWWKWAMTPNGWVSEYIAKYF